MSSSQVLVLPTQPLWDTSIYDPKKVTTTVGQLRLGSGAVAWPADEDAKYDKADPLLLGCMTFCVSRDFGGKSALRVGHTEMRRLCRVDSQVAEAASVAPAVQLCSCDRPPEPADGMEALREVALDVLVTSQQEKPSPRWAG